MSYSQDLVQPFINITILFLQFDIFIIQCEENKLSIHKQHFIYTTYNIYQIVNSMASLVLASHVLLLGFAITLTSHSVDVNLRQVVALDFRMYVYVLPSVRVVIHFESAKRQNPFSVRVRIFHFVSPRLSISLSSQSSGGVGGEQ